ncbi:MAG TPA: potassium-transporting ATPase subunit C [Streptosporangiaceae bacterium]|nr:potassium-transporting ATPase subunit C [Streptosporangiaceae bacterium]HEX5295002.1 potassium-transporting ATPase subunit C [Streptosporangiaceae bacterium]
MSEIPPDAVTASASGLDPDISPQSAAIQVNRVAKEAGDGILIVEEIGGGRAGGRTLPGQPP